MHPLASRPKRTLAAIVRSVARVSEVASRPRFFRLFPSIVLPMFLAIVDQTIVASALPAIASGLGGAERLSWVVVSYLVATTIAAPVYGRMGDALGRRRLIFIALGIFAAGSVLCAVSQSIGMLTVARVVQGAGGGGLMTLSQALVGEAIPPRERAHYQGYLAAVAVSASAFGPVAGGVLTEHFGWRSIFLVNLPTAALAGLLLLRLPRSGGSGEAFRFDFTGFALFAGFIAATLIALERAQAAVNGSWWTVTALGAAALLALVLLVRQEGRVPSPLLPLPILRHPAIWRCDVMAACHGATLVSLITFLPLYYRIEHGASSARIGLLLLPLTIAIGIGSLTTGRIVGRTGRSAIFPSVGLSVVSVLLIGISFVAASLGDTAMSLAFGVVSLFMGTVMGVVQVTVQLASGAASLGSGAATVQFSRSLGAAFGTAIVSMLLFVTISAAGPEAGEIFSRIVRLGPEALAGTAPDDLSAMRAAVDRAYALLFLCTACFATIGAAAAWTLPIRRV